MAANSSSQNSCVLSTRDFLIVTRITTGFTLKIPKNKESLNNPVLNVSENSNMMPIDLVEDINNYYLKIAIGLSPKQVSIKAINNKIFVKANFNSLKKDYDKYQILYQNIDGNFCSREIVLEDTINANKIT